VHDSNTVIFSTKPRSTHTTARQQQQGNTQLKADANSTPVKQHRDNSAQHDLKDIEALCNIDNVKANTTSCSDTTIQVSYTFNKITPQNICNIMSQIVAQRTLINCIDLSLRAS
jgi:hypothetical protein